MENDNVTVEQLEEQKASLKEAVEKREMVIRLNQNSDFRKIIEEGFMRDDAARNARFAGNPGMTEQDQRNALNAAMAAGHLMRYLSALVQFGNRSEQELIALDTEIAQLRAEDRD